MTHHSPEWLAGYEAAREQAAGIADAQAVEMRRGVDGRGRHSICLSAIAETCWAVSQVIHAMTPPAER